MREHAADPREYEMMLIVAPTVTEEGLPAVVERVSGYIAGQGGTVDSTVSENPWGRRRLAYQIDDHRDAFYVLYRFHAAAESIVEIERELKLDEQVIRYLVVRYDEMTEHEERPPRGQASADGAGSGSFRRSQPGGAGAAEGAAGRVSAARDASADATPPAAETDALAAQIAPAETAESPVPAEPDAAEETESENS